MTRERTKNVSYRSSSLLSHGAVDSLDASGNQLGKAKRVFDANCAGCHGPEGVGGKGPALAVPKTAAARTDEQLAGIIVSGIPGTVMPPSWHLGNEGVMLTIAYVPQTRRQFDAAHGGR